MAKSKSLVLGSHVFFRNSQGVEARGSLIRLSRQSVVFEVYNPYSIVQLTEVLTELGIQQGDRQTYRGRAVVTNLVNTGLMLIVSASLVDPWSDLTGLEPGATLRSNVRRFVDDWDVANSRLKEPFQLIVTDLRNYLQELSRWLEHWETDAGIQQNSANPDRVQQFVIDVHQETEPHITEMFGKFEDVSDTLDRKVVPYHRAFVQRELHPLMMSSPFMHRAFNKPLGYAGDFEMVRMMLSDPWEGPNTFAKILNAAALGHEAPLAHRNRIELLHQSLRRETRRVLSKGEQNDERPTADSAQTELTTRRTRRISILNLGCGPAVEIQRFATSDPESEQVDFRLIDFNAETLHRIHQVLVPVVRRDRPGMTITTQQRSVHEIIQLSVESSKADQTNNDAECSFDMVYCAGLFDYFRDTTCGFLVELFYTWVKPGGLVLVTNVTPHHSSRAIMSLILDWNLELRDEASMRSLAPNLGEQRTYVDETGVNVFLEIRKPLK